MKTIIFTISLFLMFDESGFSQQIIFQLFSRNQCNGNLEKSGFYSLSKDENRYMPTDTTYSCYLKDTGIYKLNFFGEERVYYFKDPNGSYFDTLNFPKIEECYQMHVFYGYCCCDAKCEGIQIDYYTNGNKRMEGEFKNGRPVDNLRFYYSDGQLEKIKKYNKKGKVIKVLDFEKGPYGVIRVKKYDKAVKLLSITVPKYEIRKMSRKDLKKRLPIINEGDSVLSNSIHNFHKGFIFLSDVNRNTFLFMDKRNEEKYIVRFSDYPWATVIRFDSTWRILEYQPVNAKN